jgi:ATP-dependent Clp protease ATP-binding subunit ClpB
VKAQEAVQAAQSLADQQNHQAMDPQDLLLALIQQQEGVVGPILAVPSADPGRAASPRGARPSRGVMSTPQSVNTSTSRINSGV